MTESSSTRIVTTSDYSDFGHQEVIVRPPATEAAGPFRHTGRVRRLLIFVPVVALALLAVAAFTSRGGFETDAVAAAAAEAVQAKGQSTMKRRA